MTARCWFAIGWIILLLVLPDSAAWAWQVAELPPPPVPPRRALRAVDRAERRERLRQFGGQLIDSLAAPQGNAPGRGIAIDVPKLNSGLASLVKLLLTGDNEIERIELRFDPEATDFAKDTIKLDGAAAMRRSAWSDRPSLVDIDLIGRIEATGAPGALFSSPKAVLDGAITIDTETLKLVNYALAKYRDKSSSGSDAEADEFDRRAQAKLDEKLARTGELKSLDDLADLILYMSGIRLEAANQRIEALQAQINAAPKQAPAAAEGELPAPADAAPSPPTEDLAARLAKARKERDQMLDVRPRIERGKDGRATSVSFTMDRSEPLVGAQVEHLEVAVTDARIVAKFDASLSKGLELYPLIKPVVLDVLQRIQTGDPQTLEGIRLLIALPYARVREVIVGP